MFLFDDLPVPHLQTALPGPKAKPYLARDEQFISQSYTRSYPLVVARGSGCVIEDVDGNRFLDCTAGIAVCNTGHCHPQVVQAIEEQTRALIHMSGTDFYYAPEIDLAERLARLAPGPSPKKVFFTNSGAESIEAAIKLARWHTGRPRIIAMFGGFHGRTYGAMSLSASKRIHRQGFAPLLPEVHHTHCPRSCTCDRSSPSACSLSRSLEETLFKCTAPPQDVAGIVVEPIQGEGGYYPVPLECLQALRAVCDEHGILLIMDEIQTGFGRTGTLFATERSGIEPDILCLAKGIASGLPLGAIVAKAGVMNWPSGSHASTFGGNPVACRAALATLELLEGGYTENARIRGEELRAGLTRIAQTTGVLQNVRGWGLMTAVDLPSPAAREHVIQAAYHKGLLLLGCGTQAIRFCPPLCITSEQVQTGLALFQAALATLPAPVQAATPARTGI